MVGNLLAKARSIANEAVFYRVCLPGEYSARNGGNLGKFYA
jgi:hypothetical protein